MKSESAPKTIRFDKVVPLRSSERQQEELKPVTLTSSGGPVNLIKQLEKVGYICPLNLALQIALFLDTQVDKIRSLILEGPSGCGKSFLAKSLSKVTGAELVCLSCYAGMPVQNLIEIPSTLGLAKAMAGNSVSETELLNLGTLSKVFLKSQTKPVIFLVDELDKADASIDTFFLGPIQDSKIWLESRSPIEAKKENLVIIFTKNFNRKIDDALLRRCHPIKMTYLKSDLEAKILSQHCTPRIVENLVKIVDIMRNASGSFEFERPPAPEELLTAGKYVEQMIQWGYKEYELIGSVIFRVLAKSEHDKAVLEHMMKYHPDFADPDCVNPKALKIEDVYRKLGLLAASGIISSPKEDLAVIIEE
ncbi:MAG: AAA family ATPase [Deltaproteobacteria bacterium]|nr:AAA family ATPase [Deltaproteobacteria bacterium]MCX7952035.1 AAA family ATPase [Deltaproteobacteria bacterium]